MNSPLKEFIASKIKLVQCVFTAVYLHTFKSPGVCVLCFHIHVNIHTRLIRIKQVITRRVFTYKLNDDVNVFYVLTFSSSILNRMRRENKAKYIIITERKSTPCRNSTWMVVMIFTLTLTMTWTSCKHKGVTTTVTITVLLQLLHSAPPLLFKLSIPYILSQLECLTSMTV